MHKRQVIHTDFDVDNYLKKEESGLYQFVGLPKHIIDEMKHSFIFRMEIKQKHKTLYFEKQDGNITYIREWVAGKRR